MRTNILLAASILLLLGAAPGFADAPNLLTYQGRLKESGSPVTGTRSINVFLCDSPSLGVCTGTGAQSVAVTNSLFRTTFTVPSGVSLTAGPWYLEVQVAGTPLLPREQLSAAPYAVSATSATTLAAPPGQAGVTVSTSLFVVNGSSLGIGTAVPQTLLDVNGAAAFGSGAAKSTFSAAGALSLSKDAALNLSGPAGNITSGASVTASGFFGNGSGLTGVSGTDASRVSKAGDTMTGQLTLAGSSLTVGGSAFSVGGTILVANLNQVGIGTAVPTGLLTADDPSGTPTGRPMLFIQRRNNLTAPNQLATNADLFIDGHSVNYKVYVQANGVTPVFTVKGDGKVGVGTSSPVTSLEVNGDAQFGSGATKSTFSTGGSLTFNTSANLQVGTTFYVGNGRVGIGTASPASLQHLYTANTGSLESLTIEGNSAGSITGLQLKQPTRTWQIAQNLGNFGDGRLQILDPSGNYLRFVLMPHGSIGLGTDFTFSPTARVHISSANAVAADTILDVSSGTAAGQDLLVVKGDGKVGIGTASPSSALDVTGNANVTGFITASSGSFTNTGFNVYSLSTSSGISIAAGLLAMGGQTVIGGNRAHYAGIGTQSRPGYAFDVDNLSGMFSPAANTVAFASGGTERLRILSNGNVAVGQTTAQTALDVNGAVSVAGTTVVTSGRVFLSTTGAAAAPGLSFSADPTSGFFLPSGGNVVLGTGGVERLRANATGVGIATGTPQAPLDVNGSAVFGSGTTKSTFTTTGDLNLAGGAKLALSGVGVITSTASGTGIPTLSACGSAPGPTLSGTNFAGTIATGGGAPAGCNLGFAGAGFLATPACVVSISLTGYSIAVAPTQTQLALTFSASPPTGTKLHYICVGM